MKLSKTDLRKFQEFEKSGWEQAADAYHRHWGELTIQSAESMLDAASVSSGAKVLDVASGAGYVAAVANERGANVTGIDFSASQVDLAQKIYPDVNFRQASADELPFENNTFDAVVMGFGINHFPNPEAAITEAFRVLKYGGWLAFTVWAEPKAGQGFGIVLAAIDEHGESNNNLPPAPPYFRFADSEEATRVLKSAGFIQIATSIVPQFWKHSTPDSVFDAFNRGAVRATAMLRAQSTDVREIIRLSVRKEVQKLKQNGQYIVPVPAALSAAMKP